MRILIVSVTPFAYASVDRLAEMVKKHNEHLFIDIMPFHPKRYSPEDLTMFEGLAKKADVIDFEYFKSAMVLMEKFPWLKDKPTLLTHHNPYSIKEHDWREFDRLVVKNKTQKAELPQATYIPHAVDLNYFKPNLEYTKSNLVSMVAFRVEGHKGIKEVAQACKELGYKFMLVGNPNSKPPYVKEILDANPETVIRDNVPDDVLRQSYYESAIHVCNSVDGFESGTMPMIEAMACGTPVLTRNIGLVPDVNKGDNFAVRKGETNDVEDLKKELKALMEDRPRRLKLRKKGFETARYFSDLRMAKSYAKMFNKVLYPDQSLVSIIIPTYNRKEQLVKTIKELEKQTHKNIEVIVCDDNSDDGTESEVKGLRESTRFPIKYINTERDGYNLAMARNMGVIEADGEILMFLDSRLVPEIDAIEQLKKKAILGKVWVFGDKGAHKLNFVENFSMIKRDLFIKAGMFNERITEYGGMSQELRSRFGAQGFQTVYVPEARATEALSAPKKDPKRLASITRMKDLLWKIGL